MSHVRCTNPDHETGARRDGSTFCRTCVRTSLAMTRRAEGGPRHAPPLEPRPAFSVPRGDRAAELAAVELYATIKAARRS